MSLPKDDYRWTPDGKNSYGHFAEFYDQLGWRKFTDLTFRKLKGILSNEKPQIRTIIDFGCGSGELLSRLSKMEFTGAGIDISPGMLEAAQLKLDTGDFELIEGNICDARVKRKFPLAVCFFDTLNHLTTKKEVGLCIKNVMRHLDNNGLFVFDFLTPEGLSDWDTTDITSEEDYFIIQKGKHLVKQNRAKISIEGFVRIPSGEYKRFSQKIAQRGITINEINGLLQKAGFSKISLRGFYFDWELDEGGRILGIARR
ncbi:MAG: methyltransferase domain-containing protein [candidate division Zixibacteria bacterium]|nr:methyltransferase domain-containing protein [candidate division Zixibacteria bacterium]